MISSQLLLSLSVLGSIFNHFLTSNNFVYIQIGQFLSRCLDCTFKSTRKLNSGISCSLDKPKIPDQCRFPLFNPHKGSFLDFLHQILEKILDCCVLERFKRKRASDSFSQTLMLFFCPLDEVVQISGVYSLKQQIG